jgi:hypothetical protein
MIDTEANTEAWRTANERLKGMARWTDKATALAAESLSVAPAGVLARWRGRRLRAQAEAIDAARTVAVAKARAKATEQATAETRRASRVRYIAPVAALGTAAVMQVAVMTDTFGGRLAASLAESPLPWLAAHAWLGWVAGMMLGLAVAACAEGGAAHLMDLYDKHLMARDSVALLRFGMVLYVAGSAALIHWWLDLHGFPTQIAWALAGMTGSSLFLWSRTSRWKNRVAMRESGHLDPALVRLPLAAKLMHPVRWAITLYLVSWEPAATTDDARNRYERWTTGRVVARDRRKAIRRAREVLKGSVEASGGRGRAEQATRPDAPDTRGGLSMAEQTMALAKRPAATYDQDRARLLVLHLQDEGLLAGQIDAQVADAFGVSTRTARRLRNQMAGQPISGPPLDGGDEYQDDRQEVRQ